MSVLVDVYNVLLQVVKRYGFRQARRCMSVVDEWVLSSLGEPILFCCYGVGGLMLLSPLMSRGLEVSGSHQHWRMVYPAICVLEMGGLHFRSTLISSHHRIHHKDAILHGL